jgi:hypothetical protein
MQEEADNSSIFFSFFHINTKYICIYFFFFFFLVINDSDESSFGFYGKPS